MDVGPEKISSKRLMRRVISTSDIQEITRIIKYLDVTNDSILIP